MTETQQKIRSLDDRLAKRTRTKRGTVTLLPDPEPGPIWFPFISVDDHVLEPGTVFEGRVPRKMERQVPRMYYGYNDDADVPFWDIEGDQVAIGTINGAVGRPIAEWNGAASAFQDFRPGVSDSGKRTKDMDLVGAWASMCFPSVVWGFAGRRFSTMKDPEVGLACLRAYNDWMIEEWCGAAPERYIPCQLPWLAEPAKAAEEIYGNAERGFKAVSFSENPTPGGFESIYSRAWDPFFAACEETGTVVNLHIGSSGTVQFPSAESPVEVGTALFPLNSIMACVDWIYSRVPVRFPALKIALSESGASWVPMVKERLHRAYRTLDASEVWNPEDPTPVEVLERNFWFASLEDPSAFGKLAEVGENRVMVETDYPHGDSNWPETQEILERDLGHLTYEQVYKICIGNACELYKTTPPPQSLIGGSVLARSVAATA